jgi:phosphinothricin acetyltransferase
MPSAAGLHREEAKSIQITPMIAADWPDVCRIYLEGIATGNATFETNAPGWEQWNASHLAACRFIARADEKVVGWAALSTVSNRCVYGGVAEVSVYVSEQARGRGIGKMLLQALIGASEKSGLWTLQAGVFPENASSIAIHERCGFRIIGRRERIGKLDGRWRDTVLLERRSPVVGLD